MDTVLLPNTLSETGFGKSQQTGMTYEIETSNCPYSLGNCSVWEFGVNEWWGYQQTSSGDGINFTWSLWFNSNGNTGQQQHLVSEWMNNFARDYYVYVGTTGDVVIVWWDTTDTSHVKTIGTAEWGKWHHIAFAFSDDTFYAYLDGVQTVSEAIGGAGLQNEITAGSGEYIFMRKNDEPTSSKFDGYIDDLAMWNRVVTEAEILTIYEEGTCTPVPVDESECGTDICGNFYDYCDQGYECDVDTCVITIGGGSVIISDDIEEEIEPEAELTEEELELLTQQSAFSSDSKGVSFFKGIGNFFKAIWNTITFWRN